MDYETYEEILKLYESGDGFEFFDLKSEYYYLLFNKEEDF